MNQSSRLLKSKGNVITSPFMKNRRITYTSGSLKGKTVVKNHNGIDIVGTGYTLDYITAHSGGTVKNAGYGSDVGYFVQIVTEGGAEMVYYHLKKGTVQVKAGEKVAQGQVLGYMGATGNVTGAHLHFGIRVDGVWIDPEPYLNADFPGKSQQGADKPGQTAPVGQKAEAAQSFDRTLARSYTVTASALRMRLGAGTHKGIMKQLPQGSKVTCYGYYTKHKGQLWLYVQDSTGTVGYCSKEYLK